MQSSINYHQAHNTQLELHYTNRPTKCSQSSRNIQCCIDSVYWILPGVSTE